jgi:hypothetical protein
MTDIYSPTDQEIIVLKSIWDSIDEMVNYNNFIKLSRVKDTTLMFETGTHQRLFNILLADFLTAPSPWPFNLKSPPEGVQKSLQNILFHLQKIGESPILNPVEGRYLLEPLVSFSNWLETECSVENVWLPSINTEINITLKRIEFIKICGNIGKHNFARLSRVINDIKRILAQNGKEISLDEGYLVLEEFYEWFHDGVFAYHSSAIAEFLNNIRWGIYDYLRPEFLRSYTPVEGEDPLRYTYKYPEGNQHPTGQYMYWELMNDVRSQPYLPRFEVTRFAKMRY